MKKLSTINFNNQEFQVDLSTEADISVYEEWDRYDSDSLLLLHVLHLLGVGAESVQLDTCNGGIWFLLSCSETAAAAEIDCPQRWIWLRAYPPADGHPVTPPPPYDQSRGCMPLASKHVRY